MIFYDLIHGYQPFDPEVEIPLWVKKNLEDIFLPCSLAMKKGIVPRGVQLQGWTIESWLNSPKPIKDLAKNTLSNLKTALQKEHIEIGTSAYSHPILPMLSEELIQAQIILDKKIIEKYLGKPTWFWPPEGAIDKRTLNIIHKIFPNLILLIPDKALGRYNFNGPIKIKFKDGWQKAIVFNVLFKDLFMNAESYRKKPKYVHCPKRLAKHLTKELPWSQVRRTVHSPQIFLNVLEFLNKDTFVLMRDWENAGSKKGLRKKGEAKEIGNFLKLRKQLNFRLPSQLNWQKAEIIPISKILPCSWDMESTPKDPFPWWQPNKQGKVWRETKPFRRKKVIEWQEIIKEFDKLFQAKVKAQGGLKKALKNKQFENLAKKTFPALHSCLAWHYLAKHAWWPDYQYSQKAMKNIVYPKLELLKNSIKNTHF